MPDISPTSAYLSDSEMIAWLQAKENDQYGKLREQMDASSDRGKLTKELTDLRASIDNDSDPAKAMAAMKQIVENHKGTADEVEVDRLLLPAMAKLVPALPGDAQVEASGFVSTTLENSTLTTDEKQVLAASIAASKFVLDASSVSSAVDSMSNSIKAALPGPTLKELSDKLKSATDELGRIDQLALINIQQVMSDARQTDQLASNILSSRDQARNSIVGNIRG